MFEMFKFKKKNNVKTEHLQMNHTWWKHVIFYGKNPVISDVPVEKNEIRIASKPKKIIKWTGTYCIFITFFQLNSMRNETFNYNNVYELKFTYHYFIKPFKFG